MGVVSNLALLAAGAGVGVGSFGVASWNVSTPEADRVVYTAAAAAAGCPQLKDDRGRWVVAVAVAVAESGARPEAHNPNPPDNSYGLWQINMLGSLGPDRRDLYGIETNEELFDPTVNARAMCDVSGGGENWQPWSVYTSGEYRDHLDEADAAVTKVESGAGQSGGGAADLPDDGGRICGVGEWLSAGNDCIDDARSRAEYLWASLGDTLDNDDTARIHAIWSELNGKPAVAGPVAQPGPGPGMKDDLPDLPGSAGLQPDFAANLATLVRYAPGTISINQGYRTPEDALEKWEEALAKYGNEGEARQWVAKTVVVDGVIQCGSNHCKGLAADMSFADGEVQKWAHNHAAEYGLTFPLGNEAWHIEPVSIRP